MLRIKPAVFRRLGLAAAPAAAALWSAAAPALAGNLNGTVTFLPIATNAYGTDDVNSCSVSRNNLTTIGGYEYVAYYQYISNSQGVIMVDRRSTDSTSWPAPVSTGITLTNSADSLYSGAIDDHDVVAMAVDGNGDMHLSWGMHNNALNYAISNPVNGSSFSPAFTVQTASNNPTLFSQLTSSGVNQVTYPEFYNIPDSSGAPSGNLVFDYRDAGSVSGGGSGNGNTIFGTYNSSTSSFTAPAEVLDGAITSVNGYQNRLVYDSHGNLIMTWTWRSTPNFQTNNNIMFAQSPDNGKTWFQQGGTTQYTPLPIIANTTSGGSTSQVAQVVYNIAQNSSLINQSSMTVDKNDNPLLATWLTPGGNASQAVSATNNPNLQYVLDYYTGTIWAQSQITHRTSDTSFDSSGSFVRDLGRPIVLVDSSNRVLVIGRSEDVGMGSYSSASTPNNNLTVYWNTISSLDSASPQPWKSFALDTADLGEYELSYDQSAWAASGVLELFYEPVGLSGETTATLQTLQWNESAFNFSSATPSVLTWNANTTGAGIMDGGGTWDLVHTNFSDGYSNYAWNSNFSSSAYFGAANGAAGVVTLGANISVSSLFFNAAGSGNYTIAGGGYTLNMGSNPAIIATVNATISAPITATGTLLKTGAGIVTLSGANSISGTIQIGTGATSGGAVNGGLCVNSTASLAGVTSITLLDNNSAYGLFQLNGSTGNINLPSSLAFNWNADNAGPGGSGATEFESIAGNNTVASPITFNVGGRGYGVAVDSGSLTFTGNLTTSAHTLYLRGAGIGSFTGVVSGSGSFEMDGPGTWTFSNSDTYSGTTNVAGGSLNISTGASITSTGLNVFSGGTLNAVGTLASGTKLLDGGIVNLSPNSSSGILVRTLASLNVSTGGIVNVLFASAQSNRDLLVTASPIFGGTTNSWQGKIDLSNSDAIFHTGSLGNAINQLHEGFNNGGWNGNGGIISSAAAGDSSHLTALGVIQNSINGATNGTVLYSTFDTASSINTDVLLKFTYYGDANLDGKVDGTDYSRIDLGYLNHSTGWFNGDFNYDGIVNGSDYALIDNAFNSQSTALTAQVQITSQLAPASVPEPSAVCIPFALAMTLSRRRRRMQVRYQPSIG